MPEVWWAAAAAVATGALVAVAVAAFWLVRSVERHLREAECAVRRTARSADRLMREAERRLRDVRPLSEAAGEFGRLAAEALQSAGQWRRFFFAGTADRTFRPQKPRRDRHPRRRKGGTDPFFADRDRNGRQGG